MFVAVKSKVHEQVRYIVKNGNENLEDEQFAMACMQSERRLNDLLILFV